MEAAYFDTSSILGEVWSTADDGGPEGALPPHKFAFYFKNGGVGTFLPLYFSLSEMIQAAYMSQRASHPKEAIDAAIATAFVDPSDPSKIILTQPADADRIPSAPVYAPNFGEEEVYEGMHSGG